MNNNNRSIVSKININFMGESMNMNDVTKQNNSSPKEDQQPKLSKKLL